MGHTANFSLNVLISGQAAANAVDETMVLDPAGIACEGQSGQACHFIFV